jgi:hypothetical protein
MERSRAIIVKTLGTALLAGLPSAALSTEQWFLMARHGECMEIDAVRKRIPDLTSDPYSFVKLMREKGLAASSAEVPGTRGKAVEVRVPERNLGMVFAARDPCREFLKR